ncbi:DUF456 family protein [Caldibacillus lycopersici]|uniref:DUF456 family protein n=1 Tax=Perspicuibacillus lycopersici TaxID=1325689 RepID=A0AAE3LNH0_9BACI|nr:DUF456 family protein [Perspicuibacillus lycopersici]MCU9613886.1 DUF456 family protein [Perspicuibacillus lycopersici]
MGIIAWLIISILFVLAFVGLVYPILPSSLFLLLSFVVYGIFYSFGDFHWTFWTIQIFLFILLFTTDYLANLFSLKKFGGSKAGMWGSTFGLLIGPFVIPFLGIIIGPFLGAVIAELLVHRISFSDAVKIGLGSVVGFIGSVVVKSLIMIFMIVYFLIVVL